ncbi:MAG: hypothetical protein LBE91_08465 [Tannerella sp.]|jgi:hypothetical protein|nr:hypothetical protein [Tannerella sp.]
MRDKEQQQDGIDLYVIDTVHEQTVYNTIRSLAVDRATFEKYFPDWKHKHNSKQRLRPKQKKA